jgi:hypothetical protein
MRDTVSPAPSQCSSSGRAPIGGSEVAIDQPVATEDPASAPKPE